MHMLARPNRCNKALPTNAKCPRRMPRSTPSSTSSRMRILVVAVTRPPTRQSHRASPSLCPLLAQSFYCP
ncbi:hypothetical protein HAX54_042592 [Datura stramonium]|uniref:Uncharacterized protein n=1 Tax=Datura stramonium TaxID=4076 RepID=A0ABS8VZQ9_DATST|nr:hypothetical protein [Datura stramonium]